MVKMVNIPIPLTLNIEDLSNISEANIQRAVDQYVADLKREYVKAVKKYLTDFSTVNEVTKRIMESLDQIQQVCGGAEVADDPTLKFRAWETDVRMEVRRNLEAMANSINVESPSVYLQLISADFMGIGSEGDTKTNAPIKWLTHFLEGTLDDNMYWINSQNYKKLTGRMPGTDLGRFGVGHLWHIPQESLNNFNKVVKARLGKDASTLKHPQSGKSVNGRQVIDANLARVDFEALVGARAQAEAISKVRFNLSL